MKTKRRPELIRPEEYCRRQAELHRSSCPVAASVVKKVASDKGEKG